MESPRRDHSRMDYYGARNAIVFVYQNVPMPAAALFLPATTLKVSLFALQPKRLRIRLNGVFAGYYECLTGRIERKPVSARAFRLFRSLKSSSGLPLAEIVDVLPECRCAGENGLENAVGVAS
jgi:hypothetical protein